MKKSLFALICITSVITISGCGDSNFSNKKVNNKSFLEKASKAKIYTQVEKEFTDIEVNPSPVTNDQQQPQPDPTNNPQSPPSDPNNPQPPQPAPTFSESLKINIRKVCSSKPEHTTPGSTLLNTNGPNVIFNLKNLYTGKEVNLNMDKSLLILNSSVSFTLPQLTKAFYLLKIFSDAGSLLGQYNLQVPLKNNSINMDIYFDNDLTNPECDFSSPPTTINPPSPNGPPPSQPNPNTPPPPTNTEEFKLKIGFHGICSNSGTKLQGTNAIQSQSANLVLRTISNQKFLNLDIFEKIKKSKKADREVEINISKLNLPNLTTAFFDVLNDNAKSLVVTTPHMYSFFGISLTTPHPKVSVNSQGEISSLLKKYTMPIMLDSNSIKSSLGCDIKVSPLIINISDKIENAKVELSSQDTGVLFDIMGTGSKESISWPIYPRRDKLLVLPNAQGKVLSIHQLFGDQTIGPDGKKAENGFLALEKYDFNHDQVINAQDSIYNDLRLWGDYNRNGEVDYGELSSLKNNNIKLIHTEHINILEEDEFGNQTKQRSAVELFDGTLKLIVDVWFNIIYE